MSKFSNPSIKQIESNTNSLSDQVVSLRDDAAIAYFDEAKDRSAWYRQATQNGKPMSGVMVEKHMKFKTKTGSIALRTGDMLVRESSKSPIKVIAAPFFNATFMRCFSDGTEICRINETKMAQAMALSKSNVQIRKRIEKLSSVSIWQSIAHFISVSRNCRKTQSWDKELRAHIDDISARHKMDSSLKHSE